MLQKLDQRYVKECVQYCSILVMAEELGLEYPITLLTLALGEHESWNHLVDFDLTYFAESRFKSVCQVLESRITSRCGGLLEIGNHREYRKGQKTTMQHCNRTVNFVHRTAMEYVQTVYEVPSVGSSALSEAQARVARGSLGTCILSDMGYELHDRRTQDMLRDSMLAISTMFPAAVPLDDSRSAKSLQIDLLDQACQTLQNYDIEETDSPTKSFFDDHGFLDRFVKYHGDGRSDRFHCMLNSRLNFAAFYGCHHYVQSCLSTETCSADQMSVLFQATVAGLEHLVPFGPIAYLVCLPRLVTIQVILQRGVELDLNEDPGRPRRWRRSRVYGTTFGRLFNILFRASHIWPLKRSYFDKQQQLKECCVELTQKLSSIGANPNTRLITEVALWTGNAMSVKLFMSYSLLSLLERSPIKNDGLKACLYSAGAIHYKGIRFVWYEDNLYRTNDAQSQRLDQLLMDFEPDWELAASFLHLEFEISAEESVREVLDSIAEKQPISEEDILTALNESGEFN